MARTAKRLAFALKIATIAPLVDVIGIERDALASAGFALVTSTSLDRIGP
jgi:hypothetical protein